MKTKMLTENAKTAINVEQAIRLTISALDRSRSQKERDELTAIAWSLLSGVATD